jgi:hypothetical protein
MREIERSTAFRLAVALYAFQAIGAIPSWNIDSREHRGRDRTNDLDRTTLYRTERSLQDFMSPHDLHQGTVQDFHV